MLEDFHKFWDLYLSVLETEIVETKLTDILESLTFKFSRQPEMLTLMPDRITETNLRINTEVAIPNDDKDSKKFYKDFDDPNRPQDLEDKVQSVLHAIRFDKFDTDKSI